MATTARHLRLVPPGRDDLAPPPAGTAEDLVLDAAIFLVGAVPLVATLAGVGRWGDGSRGIGTIGVLLAGRELWRWAAARVRAR
jgi:hypothetical protein